VHVFLVNSIRKNNHKLFNKVPGIINEAYLGALPLFMHYILSYFSNQNIELIARQYNSVINGMFVCLGGLVSMLLVNDISWELMLGICLSLALCPQFFYVFSARNFGLSSRPLGIFLVSILVLMGYFYEIAGEDSMLIFFGVLVGYLIWGSNTFAQQTIILTGLLQGLIYSNWFLIVVFSISVVLFIILHRTYATSYLYRTGLFIYTYSTQIAKLYILKERYSIWRDLVWDFYKNFGETSLKDSIKYVYRNSVLIVIFLNPFVLLSVLPESFLTTYDPFLVYAMRFSFCCFLVFIITSFRISRFLGEPERYVEMATMYSVITSMFIVEEFAGVLGISVFVAYISILYIVQIVIVEKLFKRVRERTDSINIVEEIINNRAKKEVEEVYFYSNNEEVTKKLMMNDWNFARFWSFETEFAGCKFQESYTQFPLYNEYLTKAVLETYKLNYLVLFKTNFGNIPVNNGPYRLENLMENSDYAIYRLTLNSSAKLIS